MTVHEQLAIDRALSSATISLRFVGHALRQIPDDADALRDALADARDTLAVAVDALEESVK